MQQYDLAYLVGEISIDPNLKGFKRIVVGFDTRVLLANHLKNVINRKR